MVHAVVLLWPTLVWPVLWCCCLVHALVLLCDPCGGAAVDRVAVLVHVVVVLCEFESDKIHLYRMDRKFTLGNTRRRSPPW